MRSHLLNAVTLLPILFAIDSFAQDDCAEYHRFNCERSTDTRFNMNGQSKSASVQIGVPTELNIIVYKGQDYRIAFCYDEKVIGDHVVARLIEKVREPKDVSEQVIKKEELLDANGDPSGQFKESTVTETKRVFEDVEKELWKNEDHEMADAIEFTATATKRLIVEVTAPGAVNAKPKRSDKKFDIGCVGILIEHMPTPAMGFDDK
jgi:hypothetical protein